MSNRKILKSGDPTLLNHLYKKKEIAIDGCYKNDERQTSWHHHSSFEMKNYYSACHNKSGYQ